MSPFWVGITIVLIILGIIAFDVWLWKDDVKGNTISSVIRSTSKRYKWLPSLIAFSMGLMFGHWFW